MAYPTSLNSLAPGYSPWDDTSMLIHSPSGGIMLSQDEYNLHGVEADIGSKGVARISNSGIDGIRSLSRTISSSELSKQGKPGSLFHDTQGHVQKLKEMDPINFEIVKKRE
ncbi:protein REVEILLE 8-like isoform X4 [Camellia sinensis]|uniref:protein REVEILLE 8-like isoform X4 n=1 Tax=Camellia sinensis TaxID=4442 RepID=UPI001035E968|nr:protein REVEILLE 8-like isoform X4 [Camellia sinensis]